MKRHQSIEELYSRYLANQLSASELADFLSRLHDFEEEKKVSSLMTETWNAMYNQSFVEESKLVVLKKSIWVQWLTAASVFLALLLTAYLVFNNNKIKEPLIAKNPGGVPVEILPVEEAAILTLADGTKVIIDSAGNQVARQGSTKIIKKDNQLIYEDGEDNSHVLINFIETAKGKRLTLSLADGTKVTLDALSKIQFPTSFNGPMRTVTILEGQAFFDVAHNKQQPFRVDVGNQQIIVVGTKFNLRAYQNEANIKTTLLEGKIKIRKDSSEFELNPGYELQWDYKSQKLKLEKNADLEEATAWLNDYIVLKDASITDIMRELERHYDINVQYTTMVAKKFNGEIPTNLPLSTALRILESTRAVHFKIDGKTITVSGS